MSRSPRALDLLFEHARDLLCVLDPDGRVLAANPAACRAFGMNEDGLVGTALADHVHPDDAAAFRTDLGHIRDQRGTTLVDMRVGSDTSGWRWVSWTASPADVEGFAIVGRDVTDRAQLQAQLRYTDRMLSVGTLASGMAHEINNPLAAVLANLEYARGELAAMASPDRSRVYDVDEALEDAVAGAERVGRIVASLRSFARPEDSKPRRLALSQVLDVAIDLAAHPVRHRARLVREDGCTPAVMAEESRLAQVFVNLLLNAAQALPEGRADLECIRIRTFTEEAYAVVEIEDTGPGIAADASPRIFDPFFTTKPVGSGTGLGLWVTHGIVTALGGTVDFRRDHDCTVFRVRLPGQPDTKAASTRQAGPTYEQRVSVLVIDDDPLVSAALRRVLTRRCDVETISNGRDALVQLTSQPLPDVVLCDLMMPEMTGLQLYAQLARERPEALSRLVFVTGGAMSPESQEFLSSITNPTIEKPVDPRRLVELIDERVAVVRGLTP
jgi:PAS domain S-box-containing protein